MSIFLSLLLIVALIFGMAYVMRRFNVTQGGSSQLKPVASMMLGSRERLLVVQVGEEQHLVGVTANNVNHLAKLEKPLPPESNSNPLKSKFADLLQQRKGEQND